MNNSLIFLDGLRGLAAFYVMVGHARWLLWEGYSQGFANHPEQYSLLHKVLMYAFSVFAWGHEAVILFFVLSGFVIHLRYSRQRREKGHLAQFDWFPFVGRRIKRLYAPLVFAMVLTLVLDTLGAALNYPIYFQKTNYPLINSNITIQHDPVTALGTLTFMGTIHVPEWGSNGPLWSLSYEWWFYMLYPLLWFISKRSILLSTSILTACFILNLINFPLPQGIIRTVLPMMLIWWLGVLLADVFTGQINIKFSKLAYLTLFVPIALTYQKIFPSLSQLTQLNDLLWGLSFTGLLSLCFLWQQNNRSLSFLEYFQSLGKFSYSLYVLHFPIIVFISGYLMSKFDTLPADFSWVVFGIIVSTIVSYIAHYFIEKPFVVHRAREVR